jgi:tetraprenyl-beta-curcumene synthase
VADVAQRSAARCAEGQVRVHAAPRAGEAQLEEWARAQAAGTALEWREFMAGAVSSVLAVHALIAAAANARTTPAQAAAIDSAYLSISALSTMLDSAIDYERDNARGEAWYVRHYDSPAALADRVVAVSREATRQAQTLPDAAHHTMTLVGVVAYYTSAPQARRGNTAALASRVHAELGPVLAPTLAVMRAWRGAKTLRQALRGKRRVPAAARVSVEEEIAAPSTSTLKTTTGPT